MMTTTGHHSSRLIRLKRLSTISPVDLISACQSSSSSAAVPYQCSFPSAEHGSVVLYSRESFNVSFHHYRFTDNRLCRLHHSHRRSGRFVTQASMLTYCDTIVGHCDTSSALLRPDRNCLPPFHYRRLTCCLWWTLYNTAIRCPLL